MVSNINKLKPNELELTVELAREELQKYLSRAEAELSKSLDVKSFRKGKVPKELLRQYVSEKDILSAAMDMAVRDSMATAIEEHELDVLNVSGLNVKENSATKLSYSVQIILFPEIKISDLDFKVKKMSLVVQANEIQTAVENIRASRSTMNDKEGPVAMGDRVEIDFEVKVEGNLIEGGSSKNHPLTLGKKGFVPGFEENLVGMVLNGEKNFSIVAPRDYFEKSIAGKKLDIHVKVQDIKQVTLPEVTDQFVKTLGAFNSVEDLDKSIKEGLLLEKTQKEKERIRLEILNSIIAKSNISTPDHMIEEQLESMINDFDLDLHRSGMELGPYLAHIGKTRDDLKKDWRREAERQIKIVLVLHKIARERNISASPDEIDSTANDMLQAMMARGELNQEGLEIEKIKNSIATKIINEKTLQFLEEHCSAPHSS